MYHLHYQFYLYIKCKTFIYNLYQYKYNEKGLVQHPHKKILKALEEIGHDPDQIRKKYEKYLEHLRDKALEKAQVK